MPNRRAIVLTASRIPLIAAAAALALGLASFASPAQASTPKYIYSYGTEGGVVADGVDHPVIVGTFGTNGSEWLPIDHTTVDGHSVYQYQQAGTNDCLQLDITINTVIEGGCVDGNARQQWWWDNETLLYNIAVINDTKACAQAVFTGTDWEIFMAGCNSHNDTEQWSIYDVP
jgi:hypothetical protein